MSAAVDRDFIERAIEFADLDAVRVTLFQHTKDAALAALPVAPELSADQRQWLIGKAVAWLEEHSAPVLLDEPPEAELRQLMNMVTGGEMGSLEFEARRDLPAFRRFPLTAEWTAGKPVLPDGFRVVIIGSGFSGITMAVQLEVLGIPYIVLERRAEPGGTWSINRYPDVRVDTSSLNYEFAFEKNYRWSEYFGRGDEVRNYIAHVAEKYGVAQHTRFNCDVIEARFDEDRSLWTLELETPQGRETLETNALVSATGLFANPKIPAFPNREAFQGKVVHPARWPQDLDLRGKRVAIIGNGSTGVQLLAPIAQEAERVFVFQRTPQWISPRAKYGRPMEPEIVWLLGNFPGYWNWARYSGGSPLFDTHDMMRPDRAWQAKGGKVSEANDQVRTMLAEYVRVETGGRQDLIDRLLPDYAPYARRPVVDNGWYRALTRGNVELVTDGIAQLVPHGIETDDGIVRDVDVIISATGYDIVKYLFPAKFIGRNGIDLHERWEAGDGPRAYMSVLVQGFPNLFMIYGPNSQPVAGGPHLPPLLALWAGYTARCIVGMIERGKSSVEVSHEAFDRFNADLDAEATKLILMMPEGGFEHNYYVNTEHNRLQVSSPWYSPLFHRMCTQVMWDDLMFGEAAKVKDSVP